MYMSISLEVVKVVGVGVIVWEKWKEDAGED